MKFATLEGRRVAVWGYGREGRAALTALRARLPDQSLTLFCSEADVAGATFDAGIETCTSEPDADALAAFDFVIKSPGISIYKPEVIAAQAQGTVFTSGTALWFGENPDARVIGITGTKGKSTTAAMTAHLARALGVRTALAGNIGMPLLDLDGQKADLWVVELSSFQTGEAGPLELGVFTSLYEEHLDWHGTRERYVADKLKLADVSRTLLVNATQAHLLEHTSTHPQRITFGRPDGWHVGTVECAPPVSASPSPSPSFQRKLESTPQDDLDSSLCWNDGNERTGPPGIYRGDKPILPASELLVPGVHNALNACAALAALEQLGLDALRAAPSLTSFRPLPHRLQNLGERDGFTWIDDSISTTPQAALAALDSLAGHRVTVILGGHDRGLEWSDFARDVTNRTGLRIVTQGANGARIAAQLQAACADTVPHEAADGLDAAIALARRISAAGDTILLSPGAPSFDQFHDYTERGRHFAAQAGFDDASLGSIAGLGIA